MRPLLSDDGVGNDAKVVSFPTSTELLGRGIDLTQSGEFFVSKIEKDALSIIISFHCDIFAQTY